MAQTSLKALRKRGKELRKEGKTWDEISEELGIYTQSGRINPGLTYRIIKKGYSPARLETRLRIGLPPVCPLCKQELGEKHCHPKKRDSSDLEILVLSPKIDAL